MNIWGTIKDIFSKDEGKSTVKTIIIGVIFSSILIFSTFNFFIEFSAFAVAILKAFLSFAIMWAIDRFAIPEVDTMTELKKGNYAYAIFLLALSVVIGASILSV